MVTAMTDRAISWRKYNGALLPVVAPHVEITVEPSSALLLVLKRNALLARWTTEWDRKAESEFWYVIKDSFTPLEELPAKNRSEINRGLKNCEVRRMDADSIAQQGYPVYKAAFENYGVPIGALDEAGYKSQISGLSVSGNAGVEFWGVFDKTDQKLIAYSQNIIEGDVANYSTVKFRPDSIDKYPGYSLFYIMNQYYLQERNFRYVSDGARSIAHETNIQDHLIRKQGFRRAYCRLHLVYHPATWCAVQLLYPFRLAFRNTRIPLLKRRKVSSILAQEEIRRSFR